MGHSNTKPRKTTWSPVDNMYTFIADRLYQRLVGEEKYESGWLVGWSNQHYPERGILAYTGIATKDTARKYELEFGMPIHRLPDGRPRAIPWQLDIWLIRFAHLLEEAANENGLGTAMSGDRRKIERQKKQLARFRDQLNDRIGIKNDPRDPRRQLLDGDWDGEDNGRGEGPAD